MAITKNLIKNAVVMKYNTGMVDEKGKDIVKTYRLSNIKPEATEEEILAMCKDFNKVLKHSVHMLLREYQENIKES
ncbi:DUF1659 domain-containing protein [Clostridium sp. MSJ-4]|uniref:DUF1659 domain-containing protein n=1 Tax=Clostridium simiarum TaxID=2841506 RepID=A0ABS6F4G4_9CLOT|nr:MULTISPECIES: DUF1659 domain-containing protein [Clostridium]MBU5593290.1 DUF1659 domain-containing protein [Clostridium simiarum]